MNGIAHSFVVRFRPTGPWRFGPDSGAREDVNLLFHSDAVYSAVTNSMARLGLLEDWLRDTAHADPAVRFSSLFPFQRDTLFVVPPQGVWPPAASIKVRYKGARFVPVNVVQALLNDKPLDEDRWQVDGESACLIPFGWNEGPFRASLRSGIGVDRLDAGRVDVHNTACLEFTRDCGVWMLVVFANEAAQAQWEKPLRGALKLLADSGIGGERSRGWGRSMQPKWDASGAVSLLPETESPESAWWILSLYAPAESDSVDWTRGSYSTVTRTGRTESPARWGEIKAPTVMIAEGSVLVAAHAPKGAVSDVAPEGFPHAVYRAGFAVAIPIPWRVPA